MPRIYPLFSSSKGNCTYIGSTEEGILIDCGVSYKRLCAAMELSGLSMSAVKGIFITHEHSDHIKGLAVTTKKTGLPVFANSTTLDILYDKDMIFSKARDIIGSVKIGSISVTPFPTSHDAASPCGYRMDFDSGECCCTCTDLGVVTKEVRKALNGANAVLLEANYDEKMLREGGYPAELKQRIRSEIGHLSNSDSGKLAAELVSGGVSRIILGHISQENNTPQKAEETVKNILTENGFTKDKDYFLTCAPVETEGAYAHF
ncbi:MAG: MBL fold metallo-hydrolase [Oscillospiraceae bacterium]|nr:MBL fold metallo-hydrolase [Oscillospiraceae bacterium]